MTTTRQPATRPSRRTLVKGAAWATPVIAVASAAPAMAQSPGVTAVISTQGCRDSLQGSTTWRAWVTFTNETSSTQSVVVSDFTVAPTPDGGRTRTPSNFSLNPGGSETVLLTFQGGNQQNEAARTLTVPFTWGSPSRPGEAGATVVFTVLCSTIPAASESLAKDAQQANPADGADAGQAPEVTAVPEPEDTATESAPQPVVDQSTQTATPTSDN